MAQPLAWIAALACSLGAGCTIKVSLVQLDRLQADLGVRSVARTETFTLWSPYPLVESRGWLELVDRSQRAVDGAFGPESAGRGRLQVFLEEVAGVGPEIAIEGDQLRLEAPGPHPRNGVEGHAGGEQIVLYVAPAKRFALTDGRAIMGMVSPAQYGAVLLHELAHVAAERAGIGDDDWISEGLAEYVAALEPSPDGLHERRLPANLLAAVGELDARQRSLQRLFDWKEDFAAVQAGSEAVDVPGRLLCGLYVRWQLASPAGEPVRDLAPRLRTLAARPQTARLAEESAWQAWLDAQIAAHGTPATPESPVEAPGAGIQAASDYTLRPSSLSPAPPEPTTGAPR